MKKNKSQRIGSTFEENVKKFFINNGYYTLRGIIYKDGKNYITDIDIWGYKNFGLYSYERIIVDCKNKKRPKIAERILWTIGLKNSLNIEKAFLAVNKQKYEFHEFAVKNNILILNSDTIKNHNHDNDLLSEEEFVEILKLYERVGSNFKNYFDELKTLCVSKIDIKTLNKALYITKKIMEQHSILSNEATLRIMLFSISVLFIILDMLYMKYKSISTEYAMLKISDGIKYGEDVNKIKQFAEIIGKITNEKIDKIYKELLKAGSMNFDILKEGILNNNSFFNYALIFNKLSFSKEKINLDSKFKSKILILCDYFNIKRIDFKL